MLQHPLYTLHDPSKGFWVLENDISCNLVVYYSIFFIEFIIQKPNYKQTNEPHIKFADISVAYKTSVSFFTNVQEQKRNAQEIV
jgi:K+-transporting ATPase A subunit